MFVLLGIFEGLKLWKTCLQLGCDKNGQGIIVEDGAW